jgi:hypothetical protein
MKLRISQQPESPVIDSDGRIALRLPNEDGSGGDSGWRTHSCVQVITATGLSHRAQTPGNRC